jgi:UDP-N-acetylglucosamine 1-carboxyvinyltransferase
MSTFVISGGKKLSGSIEVAGSKNAILPIMAACLLTDEECVIENVPRIEDVETMSEILRSLDTSVIYKNHTLTISAKKVAAREPNQELVRKFRSSVFLLGALLARRGKVSMGFPGGDQIGARPIDVHLFGFTKMGARVVENHADVTVTAPKLLGTKVVLRVPTVTGTENLLLASATAKGKTTIKIAAGEPHVQDLANFLNKMGAKIKGAGTHTIEVEGVPKLHGARHSIVPDNIEVGTFACLAAATRSELEIRNIEPDHLDSVFLQMELMGVNFEVGHNNLYVRPPHDVYHPAPIMTGYYPYHLPTDLQPPFAVLATQAKGTSLVHDPIFEGRLGYINELVKMGANAIIADPHRALITGPTPLIGTEINGLDIRAGITLVIAGLVAEGETIIREAEHVDRGYERVEERLHKIGADIKRVEDSSI